MVWHDERYDKLDRIGCHVMVVLVQLAGIFVLGYVLLQLINGG